MKRFLGMFALLAMLIAVPAFAQRLSSEDQKEFDKNYTKWVNHTRENDREGIAKDVRHMQEIMARNNIPANTPFEQVASSGSAYPARMYQNRLSAEDQKEFDKYYTKWVNDTRKNDRDDIDRDVRHMQEIMARYNIPANVPFDQVASTGYPGNAYPPPPYPANTTWRGRLAPEDQREFDLYYSRWIDDTRRNDRDEVAKDAGRMQAIMARYNIPANVTFDLIATSPGSPASYPPNNYPAYGRARLSSDDQREFDKYYAKWVEDTQKNDRDDIDKDVRHMQDIMARYNIAPNVPFDQIASPDAISRH